MGGAGFQKWAWLLVVGVFLRQVDARGFEGIPGNFCRNRKPSECCEDRHDDCAVPVLGTFCYCDEFCLNGDSKHDDCCPDFRQVCLGAKPGIPLPPAELGDDPEVLQKACEVNGKEIPFGGSKAFNCNECKCEGPAAQCEDDPCMVDEALIREVNQGSRRYGWRAANYTQFWGRKASDGLRMRTGTFTPDEWSSKMYPVIMRVDASKIPRSFNARRAWKGRLTGVRDQGWCGASWAFSTLGVAQDRLNILAKGITPVALSAQNLLSCAELGQKGCQGGHIDRAWNYLRRVGIVMEECYLYESGWSRKVPKCYEQNEGRSDEGCKNHYKTEPAFRISEKEEDIQWEILNNGPVQALMTVHPDFFLYQTGVYTHTGLGGKGSATHSVKLIGWGEARVMGVGVVKYWLAENSWGSSWGERGYFKIRRGSNECGIESFVLAVRARLGNFVYGRY
ncbi:uncharacterized peptidase C1-like protein F26E4.3 isoform X2 [Penaeus monodon]|uniref:uncharacterized peptidase C1-like protein F26E4.3 isoform X1 n=1 Tax=Penaeus monodon TaxID=6687 RepID=UPI0018A6D5B0|nr:uncharacterized peptidase C1-like protein F26E4.3 isoform X1 [Penaeus monodon]XP_037784525.1 uncharacterized peptidase C1-like protein F26E4.3 isoform X2 [Penaeus monodon]